MIVRPGTEQGILNMMVIIMIINAPLMFVINADLNLE